MEKKIPKLNKKLNKALQFFQGISKQTPLCFVLSAIGVKCIISAERSKYKKRSNKNRCKKLI